MTNVGGRKRFKALNTLAQNQRRAMELRFEPVQIQRAADPAAISSSTLATLTRDQRLRGRRGTYFCLRCGSRVRGSHSPELGLTLMFGWQPVCQTITGDDPDREFAS